MSYTCWVLVEANFEYDDNYYYRADSSGGTPRKVFSDKERAQEALSKENEARARELLSDAEASGYSDYNETVIGEDGVILLRSIYEAHTNGSVEEVEDLKTKFIQHVVKEGSFFDLVETECG